MFFEAWQGRSFCSTYCKWRKHARSPERTHAAWRVIHAESCYSFPFGADSCSLPFNNGSRAFLTWAGIPSLVGRLDFLSTQLDLLTIVSYLQVFVELVGMARTFE